MTETVMALFVMALLGVAVTFLVYVLIGFLVGVAILLPIAFLHRRIATRRLASSTTATMTKMLDPRHPAWVEAIARRRDERKLLLDRYVLAVRQVAFRRQQGGWIDLMDAETEVQKTFGFAPIMTLDGGVSNLDPKPPREEILHLDRDFTLKTDCRYGHVAEHGIAGTGDHFVLRECVFCDPPTRWTERD